MQLSRLWRDTQVQENNQNREFFPSNAFMAFARSSHTFNCSKKMNCELCKAVYTSIASKALVMDQYQKTTKQRKKKRNRQQPRQEEKSTSAPDTPVRRKNRRINQNRETGTKMCSVGRKGVRVHLSRLWTDTQVRNLGRKCPRLAPVETNLKKNVN